MKQISIKIVTIIPGSLPRLFLKVRGVTRSKPADTSGSVAPEVPSGRAIADLADVKDHNHSTLKIDRTEHFRFDNVDVRQRRLQRFC